MPLDRSKSPMRPTSARKMAPTSTMSIGGDWPEMQTSTAPVSTSKLTMSGGGDWPEMPVAPVSKPAADNASGKARTAASTHTDTRKSRPRGRSPATPTRSGRVDARRGEEIRDSRARTTNGPPYTLSITNQSVHSEKAYEPVQLRVMQSEPHPFQLSSNKTSRAADRSGVRSPPRRWPGAKSQPNWKHVAPVPRSPPPSFMLVCRFSCTAIRRAPPSRS